MCLGQKKQYEKGRANSKTALQEKGCSSPQLVHRWDQRWNVAALRAGTLPDPNPYQGNSLSRETKWGMEKVNCPENNVLSSTQYMQYHLLRKPTTTRRKCASHSLLSQPIRLFGNLQLAHLLQTKGFNPFGLRHYWLLKWNMEQVQMCRLNWCSCLKFKPCIIQYIIHYITVAE